VTKSRRYDAHSVTGHVRFLRADRSPVGRSKQRSYTGHV